MKQKLQGLIIGIVLTLILSGTIALAAPQMVEVLYNNIKISINGNAIKSDTEPFIYNNRTYIPARAVAEGMGGTVFWNEDTNTVEIYDQDKNKLSSFYDAVYLLGTSSRLYEIQQSISLSSNISNYEKRDSYAYNIYYESFKIVRDSFNDNKNNYSVMANSIINNGSSAKNVEVAKKILDMITKIEDTINIQTDLYVSFDLDKYKKLVDNTYDITVYNTDIRNLIYDSVNN